VFGPTTAQYDHLDTGQTQQDPAVQCLLYLPTALTIDNVPILLVAARVGKGRTYGQPWAMTNRTLALASSEAAGSR